MSDAAPRPAATDGTGGALHSAPVSFREAFRFWLKLGFINFGGPAGQIALMHQELVERKRWIPEERFLHALNFCMLLPGPEAQQLAIYVERLRGSRSLGPTLSAITAAVVGVILNLAVWFGFKTLVDPFSFVLAGVAFFGMWRWRWGIVPVVLGSALAGLVFRAIVA